MQLLIHHGRRSAREVSELAAALRGGQTIYLSLDQEGSRLQGTPLLTATHPLVHAALGVPSHRQSRYSVLHLSQDDTAAAPGTYVVHLCEATWDGVRPLHEVWTSTVEVHTAQPAPDLGGSVMAAVAAGRLREGRRTIADIGRALDVAIRERDIRIQERGEVLQRENAAFAGARRAGAVEAHERRMATHQLRIETLKERGRSPQSCECRRRRPGTRPTATPDSYVISSGRPRRACRPRTSPCASWRCTDVGARGSPV